MTDLVIRGLSKRKVRRVRQIARQNGRTPGAEVLAWIEEAVRPVLEEIEREDQLLAAERAGRQTDLHF